MVRVETKQMRARDGLIFATPDRMFHDLRGAMSHAKTRVQESPVADMLNATAYDQNVIKYRCWIDETGKFHESKPVY